MSIEPFDMGNTGSLIVPGMTGFDVRHIHPLDCVRVLTDGTLLTGNQVQYIITRRRLTADLDVIATSFAGYYAREISTDTVHEVLRQRYRYIGPRAADGYRNYAGEWVIPTGVYWEVVRRQTEDALQIAYHIRNRHMFYLQVADIYAILDDYEDNLPRDVNGLPIRPPPSEIPPPRDGAILERLGTTPLPDNRSGNFTFNDPPPHYSPPFRHGDMLLRHPRQVNPVGEHLYPFYPPGQTPAPPSFDEIEDFLELPPPYRSLIRQPSPPPRIQSPSSPLTAWYIGPSQRPLDPITSPILAGGTIERPISRGRDRGTDDNHQDGSAVNQPAPPVPARSPNRPPPVPARNPDRISESSSDSSEELIAFPYPSQRRDSVNSDGTDVALYDDDWYAPTPAVPIRLRREPPPITKQRRSSDDHPNTIDHPHNDDDDNDDDDVQGGHGAVAFTNPFATTNENLNNADQGQNNGGTSGPSDTNTSSRSRRDAIDSGAYPGRMEDVHDGSIALAAYVPTASRDEDLGFLQVFPVVNAGARLSTPLPRSINFVFLVDGAGYEGDMEQLTEDCAMLRNVFNQPDFLTIFICRTADPATGFMYDAIKPISGHENLPIGWENSLWMGNIVNLLDLARSSSRPAGWSSQIYDNDVSYERYVMESEDRYQKMLDILADIMEIEDEMDDNNETGSAISAIERLERSLAWEAERAERAERAEGNIPDSVREYLVRSRAADLAFIRTIDPNYQDEWDHPMADSVENPMAELTRRMDPIFLPDLHRHHRRHNNTANNSSSESDFSSDANSNSDSDSAISQLEALERSLDAELAHIRTFIRNSDSDSDDDDDENVSDNDFDTVVSEIEARRRSLDAELRRYNNLMTVLNRMDRVFDRIEEETEEDDEDGDGDVRMIE